MLCRLLMVLGCFLGHSGVSSVWWPVLLQRVTTERPHGEIVPYDKHFFPLRQCKLVTFGVENVRLVCRRSGAEQLPLWCASGLKSDVARGPKSADSVEKVVFG